MGSPEPGDRPLILVADDDRDILTLVALRLGRNGYEVVTVPDGQEALVLARECTPDLIILDVRMPKLTGFDVVRLLREDDATRRIPVILLTASVHDESVQIGYDAGADDYIKKPFSPHDLAARVEALLAAAKTR